MMTVIHRGEQQPPVMTRCCFKIKTNRHIAAVILRTTGILLPVLSSKPFWLTILPDVTFFDLNIIKTKDRAISFRRLAPTTIEGKGIELADSYKYLLLMEDHASRSTRENLNRHYRTIFLQRTATTDGRW